MHWQIVNLQSYREEFYVLNTVHLELYNQDGNFPQGKENQIVNPPDSLITHILPGC